MRRWLKKRRVIAVAVISAWYAKIKRDNNRRNYNMIKRRVAARKIQRAFADYRWRKNKMSESAVGYY